MAFSFRPANRLPFPTCSFSPPSFRLAYGVFFQTCQPAGLLLDVRGFSPSLWCTQLSLSFGPVAEPLPFPTCRSFSLYLLFQTCRSRFLFRPACQHSPLSDLQFFSLPFRLADRVFFQTFACSPPLSLVHVAGAFFRRRPPFRLCLFQTCRSRFLSDLPTTRLLFPTCTFSSPLSDLQIALSFRPARI